MRKIIITAVILCMSVVMLSSAAFAAETGDLLPVDVVQSPDMLEIRKVYELSPDADPGTLPREDFERGAFLYSCSDILRQVVIGDEVKTQTETETIESAKNDIDSVMSLLPPSKEITTEDGFYGVLFLNPDSIQSEVSGYGSKTSEVSVTRQYPNLSDTDTQYIPKTVDEGGKTYTLADVQWQTDNTMNVDDYEIGDRYTAIAIYSGTKTTSYVKGYTVTANYTGEVCRTGVSVIRYTVIFSGTELAIPEPEPAPTPTAEPEPSPEPDKEAGFNWFAVVIPLALLTLASAGGFTYLLLNRKKEKSGHEETVDYDYPDTYADDAGGDPGAGGGDI